MAKLHFFYDVLSPYSWLAFEGLIKYAHIWRLPVHLRPISMHRIIQESGNRLPGLVPQKMRWMGLDLKVQAKIFHIPLRPRKDAAQVIFVPGSSQKAQQFLTAIALDAEEAGKDPFSCPLPSGSLVHPPLLEPVSRQLWCQLWSRHESIAEPSSIVAAAQAAGLSTQLAQHYLQLSGTEKVQQTLMDSTDEAMALGAFGVPTMVLHLGNGQQHTIFGSDRFHVIAHFLGKDFGESFAQITKKPADL